MKLSSVILFCAFMPSLAFAAEPVKITMKSISFDPKEVEVTAGEKIVWQNRSYTAHSATADEKSAFDTGMIEPGKDSKAITFEKPGAYRYHCSLHGKSMSGIINVKGK